MRKSILTVAFIFLATTIVSAQEDNNRNERRKGPPSIKQIFKDLDKNEDGKLSLKEVKGPLKKDFKKIDLNKDGFITKKELKKAPKPKKQRREEN
jgi:Ca2+-binding EF-hand superfamily protein